MIPCHKGVRESNNRFFGFFLLFWQRLSAYESVWEARDGSNLSPSLALVHQVCATFVELRPARAQKLMLNRFHNKGSITAAALKAENYFDRIRVFERRETAGGTW